MDLQLHTSTTEQWHVTAAEHSSEEVLVNPIAVWRGLGTAPLTGPTGDRVSGVDLTGEYKIFL